MSETQQVGALFALYSLLITAANVSIILPLASKKKRKQNSQLVGQAIDQNENKQQFIAMHRQRAVSTGADRMISL